ncbi:hypothetical protein V3A08_06195, partial [Tenacibaculum maritimum]
MNINKYIDHTLLKATATEKDIINLCNEAKIHQFYAVCVNGSYVELAKIAAILMPLSSISIVIFTTITTNILG